MRDPVRQSTMVACNREGEHLAWDGLNEYDSEAVIATVHPHKLEKPTSPEMYRHHFRLLRDGLARWMAGTASPAGMPTYERFVAGVAGALAHVRANHYGQNVLIVSSGGPIATAVGHVLGISPDVIIELNLRLALELFDAAPPAERPLYARRVRHLSLLLEYAVNVL